MSCKEEEQQKIEKQSAANLKNPYDYVGSMHNEALKLVVEKTKGSLYSSQIVMNEALKASKEILVTRGVESKDDLEFTEEELMAVINDVENDFENILDSLELAPEVQQELRNLFKDMNFMA